MSPQQGHPQKLPSGFPKCPQVSAMGCMERKYCGRDHQEHRRRERGYCSEHLGQNTANLSATVYRTNCVLTGSPFSPKKHFCMSSRSGGKGRLCNIQNQQQTSHAKDYSFLQSWEPPQVTNQTGIWQKLKSRRTEILGPVIMPHTAGWSRLHYPAWLYNAQHRTAMLREVLPPSPSSLKIVDHSLHSTV